MTESNNTAYANITVLENSQNGHVAFNITAYDGAGNEFNLTQNNASANVQSKLKALASDGSELAQIHHARYVFVYCKVWRV